MSISGVLTAAVSGLSLASQRVAAAADNIANVSTPGYKASDVHASSVTTRQSAAGGYAAGGVTGILRPSVDVPGFLVSGAAIEASNVDIAQQLVGLIDASAAYKANLEVLKTGDAILKELIDIKA